MVLAAVQWPFLHPFVCSPRNGPQLDKCFLLTGIPSAQFTSGYLCIHLGSAFHY